MCLLHGCCSMPLEVKSKPSPSICSKYNATYHKEGNKEYCAVLTNNYLLLDGPFVESFDNRPYLTGYYSKGKKDGCWYLIRRDGTINVEAEYSKGELVGRYKEYYSNGKLAIVELYENGKRQGVSYEFSSRGLITKMRTFDNGILQGLSKNYHSNGIVKSVGSYFEGKKCGEWRQYNVEGKLIYHEEFNDC